MTHMRSKQQIQDDIQRLLEELTPELISEAEPPLVMPVLDGWVVVASWRDLGDADVRDDRRRWLNMHSMQDLPWWAVQGLLASASDFE